MAIEAPIDDARRENVFGLLMSLNMLIEFGDAFDYSGWTSEADAPKLASGAARCCISQAPPARRLPISNQGCFRHPLCYHSTRSVPARLVLATKN